MSELKWFLIVIVVLYLFWFATGGYDDQKDLNKPFLEPVAPIDNGRPYNTEQLRKKNPALFNF